MTSSRSETPDELRRLEEFCNSARLRSSEDFLITPGSTELWFRERGSMIGKPSRKEHEQLIVLREAVRDFLGGDVGGSAAKTLNRLAKSTLATPQWSITGEPELATRKAGGTDALVGSLLAALFTAGVTGELVKLKTCANPSCRYVFYDRTNQNTVHSRECAVLSQSR